jgi:SpoVK/Ycf46/Vps4 family AAA+-type ATPase
MPYSNEEMIKRFQKYGTVYTPNDIMEEVSDLVGLDDMKEMMEDFFLSLKKFEEIAPNLKAAKIIPNFTMLLYGPPGTGKTSLSKAMAKKFQIPIGVVEADRLVSPLLGDTVKNIRSVFELAADFAKENKSFILFFDEIDAVTSERANAHEVGEIKRAVISFLQIIDKIAAEAVPLAIFGATNHENQLDSAVWRRFTYHLKFEFPNFLLRMNILTSFIDRIEKATIGIDPKMRQSIKEEYEFIEQKYRIYNKSITAELTDEQLSEIYQQLFNSGKAGLLYYTWGYTGADLMRAMRVALFKALQKNILLFEDYLRALILVGGTKAHFDHGQELAGVKPAKSQTPQNLPNSDPGDHKKISKKTPHKNSIDID